MTPPPRAFISDGLGQWIDGMAVEVEADRAEEFASAIEAGSAGPLPGLATPMFNIVPIYSCLFEAVDRVTPADLRVSILHGAHDIRFHRPVAIGSILSARARVVSIRAVPVGTAVEVEITVVDEAGSVTSSQWATAIVRGAVTERDHAVADTQPPRSDSGASGSAAIGVPRRAVATLHADQTRRFARASGDTNAVHLDDELARGIGFDGVILHGLCTMGIASAGAIETCCDGDAGRLARLSVRFAAPAYPRGELTTEFHDRDELTYNFETTSSTGVVAIRRGIVELTGMP